MEAGGPKDLNGVTCETVRLKFDSVGLTPSDQYVFYLDPKTKLPLAWDYIPASGEGMQATWEKFQNVWRADSRDRAQLQGQDDQADRHQSGDG